MILRSPESYQFPNSVLASFGNVGSTTDFCEGKHMNPDEKKFDGEYNV